MNNTELLDFGAVPRKKRSGAACLFCLGVLPGAAMRECRRRGIDMLPPALAQNGHQQKEGWSNTAHQHLGEVRTH